MNPMIRVSGVVKEYELAGPQASYATFRESIGNAIRSRLRIGGKQTTTFRALDGLDFEIGQGEVVGVIGRNGAGKSTLLKLLSRIAEPTRGRIELYGRVASLLEIGTGFHPELTGRENIFLNGAVLGMKRAEIVRKFDEIVAFAEVERFLDTPVKFYSSGMYMRLAFAVAAHLEPDVLVVDEVLAVGDAAFQRKCMNKMQDVGEHGRTVLFVSHNMAAITRLCPRALLLHKGKLVEDGPSHRVVSTYLSSGMRVTSERVWSDVATAPGDDVVRLRAARVVTQDGISDTMDIRRPFSVELDYEVLSEGSVLIPNVHVFNEDGIYLFVSHDWDPVWRHTARPRGAFRSRVTIPGNFLAEGMHYIGVAMSTYQPLSVHFYERDLLVCQIIDSMDGDSARGDYAGPLPGVIRPTLPWSTEILDDAAMASQLTALGKEIK